MNSLAPTHDAGFARLAKSECEIYRRFQGDPMGTLKLSRISTIIEITG